MAEITGGTAKELLKLGRRTVLQRVVDEAREAGATRIIVVNSPDKPEIDDAVAEMGSDVVVAYQPETRGLGHAIACAGADDDAIVLLGDCVYAGTSPAGRMANLILMGIGGCIAVETVPDEEVHRYGIAEIDEMGTVRKLVEKPKPEATESRFAVAARYAFSIQFLSFLAKQVSDSNVEGEIGITEAMQAAINAGMDFKGVALQPGQQRVDCGTPEEYRDARRLHWD